MPHGYATVKKAIPSKASGVWDYETGVPGLVRHSGSGRYYSRFQVGGRRTMRALKTASWSVAKLKHADVLRDAEHRRQAVRRIEGGDVTVGDLADRFVAMLDGNPSLAARTKLSTHNSLDRLLHQWRACFGSDLRFIRPDRLTRTEAARFSNYLASEAKFTTPRANSGRTGYGANATNKTLNLLHRLLRFGLEDGTLGSLPFELKSATGESLLKSQPLRRLQLPSGKAMQKVFHAMRALPPNVPDGSPGMTQFLRTRAAESADLAEFAAYSGARLTEAVTWTWEDERPASVMLRGTKTEGSKDREVPQTGALKDLLHRMKRRRLKAGRTLTGRAFLIRQCREALATACLKIGVPPLTHHGLRHFFATTCIESGVDIPTVSRWLGHADGGALAMRVYGHLRQEHSQAAAAKVRFGGGL